MNPATPALRNLVQSILDREAAGGESTEPKIQAAFRACDKLRYKISKFAGGDGFRAVLSRAMTYARAEVPLLNTVKIKDDGSFEEISGDLNPQDLGELERGGVILLTQLLGLLVTFIGEPLTIRLLQDIWPRVYVRSVISGTEKSNERA